MDEPAPRHAPAAWRGQGPVVAAVACGGGLGSAARYGAGRLWPTPEAGFPWTVLWVNVTGCALIGALIVLTFEVWPGPYRLLRPFLGTGVLGGYTTFSTYSQDVANLLDAERARAALAYLALTVVAALAATWLTMAATRAVARAARRPAT